MKNHLHSLGLLILVIAALLFSASPALAADGTVTIFHTNDMHGSLTTTSSASGSDVVAALRNTVDGALLLDAGDFSQGMPLAQLSKGADCVTLMNAAGYQAAALGNHEFDYGQEVLIANAQAADFPFLAANVIDDATGKPLLDGVTYAGGTKTNNGSDLIVTSGGLKVGIFGLTTPETSYKASPLYTKGLTFEDPATVARAEIASLKAQGCEVILCVAHLGVIPGSEAANTSTGLAQSLGENSGLDAIIDGHSHTVYPGALTDGILIEQTGNNCANTGKITITRTGGTNTAAGELISAATAAKTVTPVASITELGNTLMAAISDQLKPVIGTAATTFWGGWINNLAEARLGETNLGDFITDTMAEQAGVLLSQLKSPYQSLPVVAVLNGGSIRACYNRGTLTVGDSLTVMPFGNTLELKLVTPRILYAAMENSVSKVAGQDAATGQVTAGDGRFLHVSGIKAAYNPDAAAGSRVVSLTLDGQSAPLSKTDDATQIVLASNDYLIAGGDGYTVFTDLPAIAEGGALEDMVRARITSLTASDGAINYPTWQQRITTAGSYTPKAYTAAVSVTLKADGDTSSSTSAGLTVEYKLDGGVTQSAALDASGRLVLTALADGPHTLRIGDGADVLVNNYSGAGTTDTYPVAVTITRATIEAVSPTVTPTATVAPTVTAAPTATANAAATTQTAGSNAATGTPFNPQPAAAALALIALAATIGVGYRKKIR